VSTPLEFFLRHVTPWFLGPMFWRSLPRFASTRAKRHVRKTRRIPDFVIYLTVRIVGSRRERLD
jgi:hypothetical protein